ncbi:MAG: prolipoprotein diacylglyceryl transferase [Acidobacteriota bacterium]
MHPVLFEIGGWQVPTYGVLLAATFLLGLRIALHYARREGVSADAVLNLWLWVLLSGVIGAKITLYLIDLDYYLRNPAAFISSLRSAGVLYGGLLLGLAVGLAYVHRQRLPLWKCLDLSAPALALGNALGRLGCLAAGCCYGRPTRLAWGLTFRDPQARSITGVPLDLALHPTQILLSLSSLLIFLLLVYLYRRKAFDGQIFLIYLLAETFIRFWIEFLRGDPRGQLLGLPTSQTLALFGFAVVIAFLLKRLRRLARRAS